MLMLRLHRCSFQKQKNGDFVAVSNERDALAAENKALLTKIAAVSNDLAAASATLQQLSLDKRAACEAGKEQATKIENLESHLAMLRKLNEQQNKSAAEVKAKYEEALKGMKEEREKVL